MPYHSEHSCRLQEPNAFEPGTFRRMWRQHEGKPYAVILGRLRGRSTMTEQAYRYPLNLWAMEDALAHCRNHAGMVFEPAVEDAAAGHRLGREETAGRR